MMIEGPAGTVLAAVGAARDHEVAGNALQRSMQHELGPKLARAASYKKELAERARGTASEAVERIGGQWGAAKHRRRGALTAGPLDSALPRGLVSSSGRSLPVVGEGAPLISRPGSSGSTSSALVREQVSFGAVYEYRDASGKPRWVGNTEALPEATWREERRVDDRVRELSASVVWAGVGRGPCGPEQMRLAREAVAKDRAERQRIGELASVKPYSRHNHMLL